LFLDRARLLRFLLGLRVLIEVEKTEAAPFRAAQLADSRAQGPSRALPDRIVADLLLDLGAAHPGVEVPGRVIFANVVEAEPVEIVERGPRARRAKLARADATGVVAGPWRHRRRIVPIRKARTGHQLSMGAGWNGDKPRG